MYSLKTVIVLPDFISDTWNNTQSLLISDLYMMPIHKDLLVVVIKDCNVTSLLYDLFIIVTNLKIFSCVEDLYWKLSDLAIMYDKWMKWYYVNVGVRMCEWMFLCFCVNIGIREDICSTIAQSNQFPFVIKYVFLLSFPLFDFIYQLWQFKGLEVEEIKSYKYGYFWLL